MEQLTFWNILALVLGLLLNLLSYLKKLKKENKPFRVDAIGFLTGLTGIITAFILLVCAKDMFTAAGATVEEGAFLYTIHAFICGFMPNVVLEKAIKLSPFSKKE